MKEIKRIDIVKAGGEALDEAQRHLNNGGSVEGAYYRRQLQIFYRMVRFGARDYGMTADDLLREYAVYKHSQRLTTKLLRPFGWLAAWAIYWGMRLGLWPAK